MTARSLGERDYGTMTIHGYRALEDYPNTDFIITTTTMRYPNTAVLFSASCRINKS